MIVLRAKPGPIAEALTAIKLTAKRFPGRHRLRIDAGEHTLILGHAWLYDGCEACLAALREFGEVEVLVDYG